LILSNSRHENNYAKDIEDAFASSKISSLSLPYEKELIAFLSELIPDLKKRELSNSLLSYDWQLSIRDQESNRIAVTSNKLDKVEVSFLFKTLDTSSSQNNYKNQVVKMNYSEFFEILQNLKKIDGQLHLFKN
jgi:hypothetical protein